MDITQTNLRYLLAVYELMGSNAGVAAVEVSRRMGVSKPSVTRMLGVLAKRGLLVKEPYGKVRLTERGALLAQEYAVCVDMVQRRLPRLEFSLTDSETAELACVLAAALPCAQHAVRMDIKRIAPQRHCCRWGTCFIAGSGLFPDAAAAPARSAESAGSHSHRPHLHSQ